MQSPSQKSLEPQRSSLPIREIAVVVAVIAIAYGLIWVSQPDTRQASRRMSCMLHLRQIMAAIDSYENRWKCYPPAYTVDSRGNRLHSWRSLILPYIDEFQSTYQLIDFSVPWDHPNNAAARNADVGIYRCPDHDERTPMDHTTYLVIDGLGAFSGTTPLKPADIDDGLANTVFVYEANDADAVHWMSPHDGDVQSFIQTYSEGIAHAKKTHAHAHGGQVVFGDSHTRFLELNASADDLKAIATRSGHEDSHPLAEDR